MRYAELLEYLWASWGNPWVRSSQWLVGRLLDGNCDAESRIHVPSMSSESLICHSSYLSPPPNHAAHNSVLSRSLLAYNCATLVER